MQLSKVNHHNLRQYYNNSEKIKTLYGSNDIVKDVNELYKQEFEEARLEYNSKQTRDDRIIKDYYTKISNDTKHDLAAEIIIELGDMDYWKDKLQRLVKFIHDKIHGIFGDKDEKYKEMADNLFINGILDEKEYTSVINKKKKIEMILKDKK